MQRRLSDWGGNVAAFLLVVLVNLMSSALPLNNQSIGEISAKYPSLFTPAGYTFSIWGAIYTALLFFVVYQALPSQRKAVRISGISPLFQASCMANAAWLFAWHYEFLTVSLLIMLVLLATLALIYRALLPQIERASIKEHLLVHLPFSLYTGWVTLATLANVSAVQTGNGWDDVGLSAIDWTLLKIAIAGAIGATMVLRYRDAIFVLVVAWAAYGIADMQSATPAVSGAATTLALLALLLAAYEAVRRILPFT